MPDGTLVEMPDNPSPDQLSALQKFLSPAVEGVKEIGRVVDKGVRGGLSSLPGFMGDAAMWLAKPAMSPGYKGWDPAEGDPLGTNIKDSKFGDVTKAIQTAGGALPPVSTPQTSVGKKAGGVLESIVSAMSGGGPSTMMQRAGIGLGGGVAAEGAGAATSSPSNPEGSPVARLLAAVLGSGGTAVTQRLLTPNKVDLIQEGTKEMTAADWRKAYERKDTLNAAGVDSLNTQLLGPRSTMGNVVGTASQLPSVQPKIATAVANIPEQSQKAVQNWSNTNLNPGLPERREVLHDVQGAAEEALASIRKRAGNDYASAVPAGLNDSRYTPPYVRAMADEMAAKVKEYGSTSLPGQTIQRFLEERLTDPDTGRLITRRGSINQLYKDLNQISASTDYKGLPVGEMRSIIKKYTPEYQPARDAWHSVMEGDYQKSATGLTGDIARAGGGSSWDKASITDTVLKNVWSPSRPQPQAVFALADDIGPQKVTDLLREHISKTLNDTIKMHISRGASAQTPYNFVAALAGTNAARQNLNAGLEVAAKAAGTAPADVQAGFYKLLGALATTRDLKLADHLDPTAMNQAAGKNAAAIVAAPMSRTSRLIESLTSKKAYNDIADLAISPGGLKELEAIAKAPGNKRAEAMALAIINQAQQANEEKP